MTELPGRLAGLSEIAGRYEAILCDVWGVLHNSVVATPGAGEALVRYRQAGGHVVLITNAPRPSPPIVDKLDDIGISRAAWDAIVSSGDATRAMIAPYRGRVVHHVGPATFDDLLYEGLGVIRGSAEDAEVVVVTDLDTDDDTPDMYAERVRLWRGRNLPLICANPDKIVEDGDKLVYCGGALADVYAEAGGEVRMAGKPFAPIYEEALRLAEQAAGHPIARDRILAIGDSVRTDATGAAGFGIDLLFIAGALHAEDLGESGLTDAAVRELIAPTGARLAGYMPRLAW